ncbi:hypothetical protein GCM10008020_25790 [Massilia psychrophila]|nr:hypothetical protein GCM10008020_25790 [Massilia psychrophila]
MPNMRSPPEQLGFASIPTVASAPISPAAVCRPISARFCCGKEAGNDSNNLRHDPMFKLGAARLPFDDGAALASSATVLRVEHAASRQQIYRVSAALDWSRIGSL